MKKIKHNLLKHSAKILLLFSITSLVFANPASSTQRHSIKFSELPMNKIEVKSAVYFSRIDFNKSCDATNFVKKICDASSYCEVIASDYICGNPHSGYLKSAFVKYTCGLRTKVASANQDEKLILDCSFD